MAVVKRISNITILKKIDQNPLQSKINVKNNDKK